jgi:hypothetical protein
MTLSNRAASADYLAIAMKDRIDELLNLIEAEPDRLRAAELLNTQAVLESLVGKTVIDASLDETRVTISTGDGRQYHFYGFLGTDKPH